MKKRDLAHWHKGKYFEGLLMFAQTLEESLFYCSFESYKMPALNSHFLCYDMLQTAYGIENKILMDGNFVPLAEEFEEIVHEDIFVKKFISESDSLLLERDRNGNYYDAAECDLKAKISHYPQVARFLLNICEVQNTYLQSVYELLNANIFVDSLTTENRSIIYQLARSMVTDLVNGGYSKEYIYLTTINFFFSANREIKCSEDELLEFFNNFTFEKKDYQIIFGLNKRAAMFFKHLDSMEVREPMGEERKLLNLQKKDVYVAELEVESIDSYSAFEGGYDYVSKALALHRINQHEGKMSITSKAIVKQKISEKDIEKADIISLASHPMKKQGNTPDLHAFYEDITLMDKIDVPSSFFRAIMLHAEALESEDVSNQLLNLWTAVEVLIETKRDNTDRINAICLVLCSVLNRSYLYSQINQLVCDIESNTDIKIDNLFALSGNAMFDKDINKVEKLALILSLDIYSKELDSLTISLEENPLLKYRVESFSKYTLKDSKSIYEYIKRHERRVRWHIMRIYRNRNMIVHDGQYMPYRDTIIENLHFYLDTLMDTIVEYYHIGLLDHESIYRNIMLEETEHYIKLGVPVKTPKQKQNVIQITADNALELFFNGYRGNMIKNAISRIAESKKLRFSDGLRRLPEEQTEENKE